MRASTLLLPRWMKEISPSPPIGMRGLLMRAILVSLLQPLSDVAGREPEVLAELVGPRRPAGQPSVIDRLHGDTEVPSELLDPDQGLEPQFRRTRAQQMCEHCRANPKRPEPTALTPDWAALRTCQCDG